MMNGDFNNFLPSSNKKSLSPMTPKESWQFEKNIEYLKQGLFENAN
jgi:hypothetical protein